MQQLSLWGEKPRVRCGQRVKKKRPSTIHSSYLITGVNDCEIIEHSIDVFDLAGCTICLDCGVRIFCPCCTTQHPQYETAIAVLCERHEQPKESQVSA